MTALIIDTVNNIFGKNNSVSTKPTGSTPPIVNANASALITKPSVNTSVSKVSVNGNAVPAIANTATAAKGVVEAISKNVSKFGSAFSSLKSNKALGSGRLPEYKVHVISSVKDFDGKPIRVSAYLPETISVDFSSDFKAPFEHVMPDNLAFNLFRAFGNTGIVQEMTFKVWDGSRGLSFDLPLVFVADDEFNDDSAENSDILIPILKLSRLCAPSKVKGSKFLRPPGPRIAFNNNIANNSTDAFTDAFNEANTSDGVDVSDDNIISTVKNGLKTGSKLFNATGSAITALVNSLVHLENVTSVYIGNFLFLDSVSCEAVSQQYDIVLGADGKPLRATVNFRFTTSLTPTIEDLYKIYGKSKNNANV